MLRKSLMDHGSNPQGRSHHDHVDIAKKTLRIVNQKTNQQADKLRIMPLSSNGAESKTTLFNLGLKRKTPNSLNTFSPQKTASKYQQPQ
jgi:hypothetical protein